MTVKMIIEMSEELFQKIMADIPAFKAYMSEAGIPVLDILEVGTVVKVPCAGGCGRIVESHGDNRAYCTDCYAQRVAP